MTQLSGVHIDKEFKVARERKRKPSKPYPKESKESLERSIVVVNKGSMACINTPVDGNKANTATLKQK